VTLLAYRFALDPTPAQERALRCHAGAARVAFNWGLARVRAVMDQRAAEATYGLAADDLTPSVSWSLCSLREDWNAAKGTVAPWWAECSKEAFNTGLDQLARALKNWGDSRKGQCKGKPAGFPRFRSRRKARPSIRFTTGGWIRREPSNRWRRASAALGNALGRVADQREDGLHKLTTRLASEFGTVVVEDLNVAGMMNAALNLAEYGRQQIAGSGPEISHGRGADRQTASGPQVAVKRQPGTARAGQAGTVPRQRGTAKVGTNAH
jgi:transposase